MQTAGVSVHWVPDQWGGRGRDNGGRVPAREAGLANYQQDNDVNEAANIDEMISKPDTIRRV